MQDRVKASVARLIDSGGARRTFRLKPEANRALEELMALSGARTATEVVERLLIEELKRVR